MGGSLSQFPVNFQPKSQLLEFLQSQRNIREFQAIPKPQLILGEQSQFPAIFEGKSQVPVDRHQDPPESYGQYTILGLAGSKNLSQTMNLNQIGNWNTTRACVKMIKSLSPALDITGLMTGIRVVRDAAPDVKHDAEQLSSIGTVVNFWTPPKFQGAKVGEKFYHLAQLYHSPKPYTNGQLKGYSTNGMRCQTIQEHCSILRFAPALNEPLRNNQRSLEIISRTSCLVLFSKHVHRYQ